MASNQVNINLNLQDQSNSIKNRTDEVKNLNKELQKSQNLATGTKSGSRAAAASLGAGENIEYGRARGSMGSTGASGRDFANQAQGLGGLVRLYATYAANVFAVSAAFSALSNAMDTSNMVKGLDQLGAASGVAMGALAKQFTEASGGAISLRESMEATAKAISSGMTQKQFLQLGDVAKKASQALGVNMSDAVSRLTRGITKLEPELLDELGLFTKVGKSSEDYARSIGKSVDSLTDFEKRQAFANAVLKEGIDKFNEINIPTNPYDKLLASLKNIAQTILEVLNKAFVPLVDLLSASPAALTAGIAALGSMIVKQAIPSIVNYRDELRKTAELSRQVSTDKISTAETMLSKRRADVLKKQDDAANAKAEVIDKLEAKLKTLSGGRIRKDIADILTPTGGIKDITEKQIQQIEAAGKGLTKNKYIYDELAKAIRAAKVAEDEYLITAAKLKREENAPVGKATALGRLQASAEEQRKRSASSTIVSNAADTASLVGFRAAFTEMLDSLKTQKLGAVRSVFTGVTATVTAATTRIMGFIGTLGNIGMAIGVLVGTFQALSYAFGNNDKEVQKFNNNLELGNENAKALSNTYDKYKQSLSPAAVIALATSFQNLSENLSVTVESFKDAIEQSSKFDRIVNSIKGLFGQGLEDDFAKSINKQIIQGLKGIVDPSVKKEAETKLRELLNVNEVTENNLKEATSGMGTSQLAKVGRDIAKVFEQASIAGQKTAGVLTSVKDGFKALETSYADLSNSLMQKDPLSNFGKDLTSQGFKLAEAFKDPIANLSTLQDLLTDVSKIKLLSPDSQKIIMENRDAYVALINNAKFYEQQIAISEKNIADIRKQVGKDNTGQVGKDVIAKENANIKSSKEKLDQTRTQMTDISAVFKNAAETSIKKGFELIEGGFTREMAKASLSSQASLLDKLPKTVETARLGAKLENQKIELDIQQITETQRLIKEMELLRLSGERLALERSRDEILKTETNGRIRQEAIDNPRLKEITDREKVLQSKNISADIKAGKLERSPDTLKAMQEQKGALSKVTQLRQQQVMNTIAGEVTGLQSGFDAAKKKLDNDLKDIITSKEAELRGAEFSAKTLEAQDAIVNKYVEQEDAIKRALGSLDSVKESATAQLIVLEAQRAKFYDVADLAAKAVVTAEKQVTASNNQFDAAKNTADAERARKTLLAVNLQTMGQISQTLETQVNLTRIRNETENALVDIQKEILQNQLDLGVITTDTYREQLLTINRMQTIKERDIKLDQLQNSLIATRLDLAKQLLDPKNAGDIDSINAKAEAASQAYLLEVEGVNKVYEAKQKTKTLDDYLTDRQLKYGDILKNSFEGMADAVIEFTKTGKLNFKSMIDSFIEGLIRYEMQQQAIMMSTAFKPAFMNFVGSIFGNMGNTGSMTGTMAGPVASAKGSVYDTGLKTFAKGGMFTNSVVNQPTLFKFAQGTGLMGEAGPEAIMPLKRDSNGNLGVRAAGGGGNVDVVVNNYSTAQAETKETVDSRGNRKIEVVIGDMTAGEISRNGSASQKAIRGTFGLQPQLIRR